MGKAMIGKSRGKNVPPLRGLRGGRAHVVARGVSLFDSHRERLSTYEPWSPCVLTDRMVSSLRASQTD